ncbi:MAG: hypothetical protein AB7I27_10215 [Bacteriovoracaceae bacterium]
MLHLMYLVSFLIFSTLAFANDKSILIRKIQGSENLNQNLTRQLDRLNIQVASKQPELQLILSSEALPSSSIIEVYAIESEVTQNKYGYNFEARLIDIKRHKLIAKSSLQNIREEDLIRLYQSALESLFASKEYQKLTNPQSPKDPVAPPMVQRPKTSQIDTLQKNTPDENTIDFRKRVLELQSAVDKEIAQKRESEEKKKLAEKKGDPTSAPVSKKANEILEEEIEERALPIKPYPRKYSLSLGWENRQLRSEDLVITSAKAELLRAKLKANLPLYQEGRLGLSSDLSVSRGLSVPAEIPMPWHIGGYGAWWSNNWSTFIGLHRDNSFFFNLPDPGQGIKTSSIITTWYQIGGEYNLNFNQPWLLGFKLGLPMEVKTSYSPLKEAKNWKGSFFQLYITPPYIVRKWEMHIMMERSNLSNPNAQSTQGVRTFSLNESRLAVFIQRSI